MLSYVLSFVYVGIYLNDHHHTLSTSHRVSGAVLWANLHLLVWLSLFPFTTVWMGESYFTVPPTVVYGVVPLMAAIAYAILQRTLIVAECDSSVLRQAFAGALPIRYRAGVLASMVRTAGYVLAAVLWLVQTDALKARCRSCRWRRVSVCAWIIQPVAAASSPA